MRYCHIRSLLFIALFCCFASVSFAQFSSARIGVNGLTCSQCSRSVELSIKKLGFVQDVRMDLRHTEGTITFKQHEKVDMDKIAKAVTDAGFSVRSLNASFDLSNVTLSANDCFNYLDDTYQFVKAPKRQSAMATIQFIGAAYMPKKELSAWQPLIKNKCGNTHGKIYYIMM
jgi:copper chaperone CopZ